MHGELDLRRAPRQPGGLSGPAGAVTIGSFLMQGGTGATTGSNPVIHQDPVNKPFALQLRYGGRSVGCGTFAAS